MQALPLSNVELRETLERAREIAAQSRDGVRTWDALIPGPEVGTYYGNLRFLTAGDWAVAIQFRRDSTAPLERIDWMQAIRNERAATP